MTVAKLKGKPLADVRELLKDESREELIALVFAAVTVEPLFRAPELGKLLGRRVRDIRADMNAGKFGDLFCFGSSSLAVTSSGVRSYLQRFRVAKNGRTVTA